MPMMQGKNFDEEDSSSRWLSERYQNRTAVEG